MSLILWNRLLDWLANLSRNSASDAQFNPQEKLLIISRLLFLSATLFWGFLYSFLGEIPSGLIPFAFSIFLGLSLIIFLFTRDTSLLSFPLRVIALILPLLLQLSLGGFVNSSAVILWSFTTPLSVLLSEKPKVAKRWFIAYMLILIIGGILNPYFVRENNIPADVKLIFFVMNLMVVMAISFTLLLYMVNQKNDAYNLLAIEQEKSATLLLNILPEQIAEILKDDDQLIADAYPEASILFADLVGFTPLSNQLSPIEMVQLLNEVYSHFDLLVEKYGLEKIRTIGDNYMVASGVPASRPDHAQALAKMAIGISEFMASFSPVKGKKLQFRIGINSGPLVAGVVGKKKFQYDVWGDVVNIASRMESHGVPGKIQVTQSTYKLLRGEFELETRGLINVKGMGEMETWFLIGNKC